MKIRDALGGDRPAFSFEFFPPKDDDGTKRLFETVAELREFSPTYVSVTYGAGGSTREKTVDLVGRLKSDFGLEAMAHLTCVGATREELRRVADELASRGVENVLPLRGDPPLGQSAFRAVEGGFTHASELAVFLREHYDFCLAGAAYPEKHPEASSPESDLEHLLVKVRAGASFLITQLFFDPELYFSFTERAKKIGIDVPIVAGVLPITNLAQAKRFTDLCGATIPGELLERLESAGSDKDRVAAIGLEHAVEQCKRLIAGGAPGIHFYTVNRARPTKRILEQLR